MTQQQEDHIISIKKNFLGRLDDSQRKLEKYNNFIQESVMAIEDLEIEIDELEDQIHCIADEVKQAEKEYSLEQERYEKIKSELEELQKFNFEGYSDGQISELLYGPDNLTLKLFENEPDLEDCLV